MTALELSFSCEEVLCEDGYGYPFTFRIELAYICKENPRYIWKERKETGINLETKEKYNLITIFFNESKADCVTFAVPYEKPSIYPEKIWYNKID